MMDGLVGELLSDDSSTCADLSEYSPSEKEKEYERTVGDSPPPSRDGQWRDSRAGLSARLPVSDTTATVVAGAAPDETDEDYPRGIRLGLIALALCLSIFLMALDEFRSLGDVGWYGSSYLLTTASLQLFFGRLYTFFSIKAVFLAAITLFEVGSLMCGLARTSLALIMGRVVAGIGSAGIFAGALVCLAHSVPLARRPLYHGCIGSMWGIAAVAGPLLGGVFTDKVDWRWCFLINLPLGAVTLIVIGIYFRDPKRDIHPPGTILGRIRQLDPIGTLLFIPAIVLLFLALEWGGTAYPWSDPRVVGPLALSALLGAAFVWDQRRQGDDATVPVRIFGNRTVWSASFFAFNTGAAYLLAVYFLPIYFQAVKGASATGSGVLVIPLLLTISLVSVLAGSLVTWLGYYAPFMIAGSVLMSVGFGLFHTVRPDTPYATLIWLQALAGTGIGLGLQQPLMAVQTVLPLEDVPTGTSVIMFMQTVGAALAVSLGQTVLTNRLVAGVTRLVPDMGPRIVLEIGATSIRTGGPAIPPDLLPDVTAVYNDALAQTFLVSAAAAAASSLGAVLVEWRSVKGRADKVAGGRGVGASSH